MDLAKFLFVVSFVISFTSKGIIAQNCNRLYTNIENDSIVLNAAIESYTILKGCVGKLEIIHEDEKIIILKYEKIAKHFQDFVKKDVIFSDSFPENKLIIQLKLDEQFKKFNGCEIFGYSKKELCYIGEFDNNACFVLDNSLIPNDSIIYIRFCFDKIPYALKVDFANKVKYILELKKNNSFYDFNFEKENIIKCKKKSNNCIVCSIKFWWKKEKIAFLLAPRSP